VARLCAALVIGGWAYGIVSEPCGPVVEAAGGELETRLSETISELQAGHANARRVLDYLDRPYEIYERSGSANRLKLNRAIFQRLWIDASDERGVQVADDELTDPFATIVYLRRTYRTTTIYRREEGGIRIPDTAFHSSVLELLKPIFVPRAQGSSSSTLAEDRGFEPLRDFSQPAFQASAIGH
jgi:hypothetical protein